jgi:DivIVA domain-containing protein
MRKRKDPSEGTFGEPVNSGRLSPMEIQQKEFAVTRVGGGYRMRDVDEFLDEITTSMTALVEENRRLREQAGNGAMIGAPDLEQVSRQADEIIRRARDEAAQIVREAHAASAASATGASAGSISAADRAAISGFLGREREFLQSLAGLVQGHAEAVKGMAREARDAAMSGPPTNPPATTPAPAATQGPATPAPAAPMPASAPAGEAPVPSPPEPGAPSERPATPPPPAAEPPAVRPPTGEPADVATRSPVATDPPTRETGEPVRVTDDPVRIDEPEPATVGRSETEEGAEEGDRSLRELFWGED